MSEEEGEMEDPSSTLQEPFLSSPSAAQTLPDDSIRSTLSKYVSLAAVASGEEADSVESESDRERDLQVVLVGILGKPYADNTNFWCKLLPLSLLAGALMGVTTLLYQGSLQVLFHLWHPDAQTQRDSGEWKWLFLTSFGALGSALILLFPKAPNPGSVRNLFHDVNDLKVRKKNCFWYAPIHARLIYTCWFRKKGNCTPDTVRGSILFCLFGNGCSVGSRNGLGCVGEWVGRFVPIVHPGRSPERGGSGSDGHDGVHCGAAPLPRAGRLVVSRTLHNRPTL